MADLSNTYPASTYLNLLQVSTLEGAVPFDINNVFNDKNTILNGQGNKVSGIVFDQDGDSNAGIFLKNLNVDPNSVWGIQVEEIGGVAGLNFWRPFGSSDSGNKLFLRNSGTLCASGVLVGDGTEYTNFVSGRISVNNTVGGAVSSSVQYGGGFSISSTSKITTSVFNGYLGPVQTDILTIVINMSTAFSSGNVIVVCSIDSNGVPSTDGVHSGHWPFKVFTSSRSSSSVTFHVMNVNGNSSGTDGWDIHTLMQFSFTAYCVA